MEIVPGISVRRTPGHCPHHQSVLLMGDDIGCFLADVIPTSHHLPLPWIMGYDVEPLVTLETKRTMWAQAADEEWTVVFEHDSVNAFGRIVVDGKGFSCAVLS